MFLYLIMFFSFVCFILFRIFTTLKKETVFSRRFIMNKKTTITKQMPDDKYLRREFDAIDKGSFRSTSLFPDKCILYQFCGLLLVVK
jgi:hypothetical protein